MTDDLQPTDEELAEFERIAMLYDVDDASADTVLRLVAEVRRLRALIVKVDICPVCHSECGIGHEPDCPWEREAQQVELWRAARKAKP